MKRLKLGDKATLNGHEGTVTESLMSRFYIREDGPERFGDMNYKFLAGDREEALDFCEGVVECATGGGFPECNTLEDLTKLVGALKKREKSAEECVTEEDKTPNTITAPLYAWKNDDLKEMWARFIDTDEFFISELFHKESLIGKDLEDLGIFDAFTEKVQEITIDGMEYYIRKSEVGKLNLITNE